MKRIYDKNLIEKYFNKYDIENLFDENIINYSELHFYENGELILEAQEKLEYYYLLVEGKIKISYLFENGKSMFLKFYSPLKTIGDIELFENIPIRCDVETISEAYLIAIPAKILREEYYNNLNFLHHLINSLSEKLDATINNSSYNFIYPLINRLASYLVEYIENKEYIVLNSSFKEIAQFLGTTYRHLSRTFNELEEKAIIRCEDKKIFILDEERLRELSKNLYK
ncbi:Crp/Fnr family transcriptional regulator [Clostridium sp. 'White wine YQ']|uniref:Crp/Fnr family transcriptional regulator n=1 Tax=Clostridium sp. 'White wine YQ' TaxID=3027474 RepID=UPI0023657754|nr:helix-turn-helix domain-containing protein [Clostridium sp. 'White wine YQ']MDD7794452.1 helix-turn-helix domain-containing protein [Clostridium sp. 'White wine YQ']